MTPEARLRYGLLEVEVYPDAASLGEAAALRAASVLQAAVAARGEARLLVATGNSQLTFFAALRRRKDAFWPRLRLFHLDEYLGIEPGHPASFRAFAERELVRPLEPLAFHPIAASAPDPEETIAA